MDSKDVKIARPMNVWEQRKAAFPPKTDDIIAQVIGKPVSPDDWKVLDVVQSGSESLALAHYTDSCDDLQTYGNVRGVVVDTARKFIACKSFGYAPIATTDKLSVAADGSLTIVDNDGNKHVFESSKYSLRRGYEGVIIRVFKHNNKIHASTFRRLNIEKSRWGSVKTFLEMYKECGGPEFETLFDPNMAWSPFVWIFIVVHPQLLTASKQNVGRGYVKLLGIEQVWDPAKPPGGLDVKNVEQTLRGDVKMSVETFGQIPTSLTYPASLSLEEANAHLTTGWYDPKTVELDPKNQDPRVTPGEFLFVYGYNNTPDGTTNGPTSTKFVSSILRVQSSAYTWRCTIRDNDPNIKHRFYDLMRILESNNDEEIDSFFADTCVLFPDYKKDIEAAIADGPLIYLPAPLENAEPIPETIADCRRMLWLNLLMASPPQQQNKVVGLYKELKQDSELTISRFTQFISKFHSRQVLEQIDKLGKFNFLLTYYRATSFLRKNNNLTGLKNYVMNTINGLQVHQFYRLMVALRRVEALESKNKK